MTLYNKQAIENIQNNIVDIINNVERIKVKTLEPTMQEFDEIIDKIIKPYIIKNKRICYGDYVLNEYVKQRTNGSIYDDTITKTAITFYSENPILDVYNLCNLIDAENYKFVSSRQLDTFMHIVTVNFVNYCVIKQVSNDVQFKTKKINDMIMVDPLYIYIDKYFIFNDPLNNSKSWPIEFEKFYELQKCYDIFNNKNVNIDIGNNKKLNDLSFITDTMIIIGQYAYNYFIGVNNGIDHLEIISNNFNNDVKIVKDKFTNLISREYEPYFDYVERKIIFYENKKPIITLYDTDTCYPSIVHEKLKFNIGTFTLTLMMLLINDDMDMASNLVNYRNGYLEKNNKSVLDDTLFKEFGVECNKKDVMSDFKKSKISMEKTKKLYYYPKNKDSINLDDYKKIYDRTGKIKNDK
jgi:hypothetical protein